MKILKHMYLLCLSFDSSDNVNICDEYENYWN